MGKGGEKKSLVFIPCHKEPYGTFATAGRIATGGGGIAVKKKKSVGGRADKLVRKKRMTVGISRQRGGEVPSGGAELAKV